jgi:serine/threonine-protein kinase
MGTPGYMSPEQAAGDSAIDARSDIYSLAVVAYELLAGVPPFTGQSARSVLAAHLSETPRPVTAYRRDVPPAVSAALDRALAKDPVGRFSSAAEFRDALGGKGTASGSFPHRLAIAATIMLLVVFGAAAWLFTARGAGAELDGNLVAVAPFDVLDPSLGMWKEGIVDILSANLDGAGPLRTVPPTVVVRRWSGRSDAPSAADLGERVRARYAIYGRFVRSGADSVRATATLYDVAVGRSLGDVHVRDVSSRLDRVADSLTIGILQQLNQSRPIAAVRTASIGTSSLQAIKAFLQAEQYYRRSEWDSAASNYRVAIAADSMFAPALRHLSNALGWTRASDQAELERRYQYAFLAGERNHGLAPRESLLVSADSNFAALQVMLSSGAVSDRSPLPYAHQLFATLEEGARRFPDDPEVWHKLADAHYHYLFFDPSITYAGARTEFDRSIALDSSFAPSYLHMPDLALRAQDPVAARRYVEQYLRLEPSGSAAGYMRMLLLFLDPATSRQVRVDSLMHASSVADASELVNILLSWMDPAESQLRVARALRELDASPAESASVAEQAQKVLLLTLAERGHLAEAARNIGAGSWFVPQLALLGAIPPDSADRMLAKLASDRNVAGIMTTLRWWVERGDTLKLRDIATRMDTATVRPGLEGYMSAVRAAIHAHLSLARHDTTAALSSFEAVPDSVCSFEGCYAVWYTKAQLLGAVHRDSDAMRILDHEYTNVDPARTLWRYERARVAERLGDHDKAVRDYAYVAAAFQHADSSLQPMVAESRAALARLGGESR